MRVIILTLVFALLASCGQTGDLYLPEEKEPVDTAVAEDVETEDEEEQDDNALDAEP